MGKFYLRFKDKLFYFLLGLIIFVPLYPKFPLMNVPGTYVAIRIEDLLIGLLGIAWLLINRRDLKNLLRQPIYQMFLLFWLIGLLSVISGFFVTASLKPHLGILHWLRRAEMMSLFIIAATTIKNAKQVRVVLITLVVTSIIIALYGFGQIYLNFPVVSTTNREFSKGQILYLTPGARVNSTFAGHYDLAAYISLILVFLSSVFFYLLKVHKPIKSAMRLKSAVILAAVTNFALLGYTAARTSFFAAVVGISLALWFWGRKKLVIFFVLISMIVALSIPQIRDRLIAFVVVNTQETTIDKTVDLPSDYVAGEPTDYTELEVSRSSNIRFYVEWPRAIRAFEKNPLLGTGYSSINIATDNGFLRSLGETGLLGTLTLGMIFIMIVKKLYASIKIKSGVEEAFIIASFSMIVIIMMTGLFFDILEASKVAFIIWTLLGIAWAIVTNYSRKDEKNN